MPENRSRLVWVGQQAFAFAVVATVAASAVGVVELEIVAPSESSPLPPAPESSLVATAPVEPTVRMVPLAGDERPEDPEVRPQSRTGKRSAQEIRVVSAPEPVHGFATVGVTWENGQRLGEEDVEIAVRTREGDTWSEWHEMHVDAAHAPDPGSPDARGERELREGTDAVVVGDVDDVQVRAVAADGQAPEELSLSIVDPGKGKQVEVSSPGAAGSASAAAAASGTAEAVQLTAAGASRPTIFTRKDWGADERLRDGSPRYGEIHGGFVHHTVNANDYSRDDVPRIIRGIYAYHTQSRGWSDVGYNFLVDRFGRIWEGRAGGIDRPVIGAHTLGYNENSFAMSAIGNFEEVRPSEEVVDAYAALMAWKLSLHGVAADDTSQRIGSRTFHAINGHRDAGSTACPGRYLYDRLGDIRARAARLQQSPTAPTPPPPPPASPAPELVQRVRTANLSGSAWPDLAVRDRVTKNLMLVRTQGQLAFGPAVRSKSWEDADLVVAPGDLDGDGIGDLLARDAASGRTTLHPGAGDGTFRGETRGYPRFSRVDQLTGVGDFDGDGHADLVGRKAGSNKLLLHRGKGGGALRPAVVLADDWSAYDVTAGVDDLDGDGSPDLVARSGKELYLVPGQGSRIAAPRQLARNWGGIDILTGRGDVTGDGIPDVLARSATSGNTYIYPGDGHGDLEHPLGPYTQFAKLPWLAIGGQLAESRWADLVGLSPAGRLRVDPHTGRRNLSQAVDTGIDLADRDLLLNVGDWNGDGRGDVMTRHAETGRMTLHTGRGRNRFAAPVDAGRQWGHVEDITAVGDMDGDGDPDLFGVVDGKPKVFLGDGEDGFGKRVPGGEPLAERLAEDADGYDWLLGIIDVDGDERGDLIGREAATGYLWLVPGVKGGYGDRRLIGTGFDDYDLGG